MSFYVNRFAIKIEPFIVDVQTNIKAVTESIQFLYSDYDLVPIGSDHFSDFTVSVELPKSFRRWIQPQVLFSLDGNLPFKPLPISQAYPLFEWGLNWCIATTVHCYLIIHAAVVEKNDKALILCGQPGAGKSTLCAALIADGWRLLSDEMAMLDLKSNTLIPVVRPVSLKNQSIDIIRNWSSDAVLGPSFYDTAKGTVAHLKPPRDSVLRAKLRAKPFLIVFPKYLSEQKKMIIEEVSKGETVLKLAENSFNYNVLGVAGFNCLCDIVEKSQCYNLQYSDLNQVLQHLSDFVK